jgi:dipeptidyl aminopeptidase/acylaminoacyl peptidase
MSTRLVVRFAVCALVLLTSRTSTLGAQQKRAFSPADWYRVTTVSSPAMSPDGERVAFTVTTVNERENQRHNEVWVVPTTGGEPVRWTSPGTESSNPRWSHDGKYLFFTSQRQGGRGSTWSIRIDQPSGEAIQVEGYPSGSMPADHRFAVFTGPADGTDSEASPDGARSGGEPFAGMPATARPPFAAVTKPLDEKRFDGRHIVDFPYKANGRGFVANRSEARRFRPAQLWKQNVGDTARTRITDTPYSHANAAVSPDGRWIAFTAHPELLPDSVTQLERDSIAKLPYDAQRDESDRNDSDIFIVPAEGGEPRRLISATGSERALAWSADGRRLAWIGSPRRTASNRLWVIDVAGGEPRNLLGDWQYEPDSFEWLDNGDIVMEASIGGRDALFRISTRSGERTEIVSGRRRINGSSMDAKQTKIAFVATSLANPTELFLADIDGRNERRLTGFNEALLAEVAFTDGERFTYESVGGFEIEGWLLEPFNYDPARKYPVALYIHGGPHSAYGENWFDEFQNLTGAGMFVLFTNPRGSSGYGADFTYSTRGRWGMEDYEDLMKAVDIVARRPDVDSTKMGVTGGSYGGFMTAWVTTKTNRFKAAQADRMISNWVSWYGTSEAQGLTEFEFYGKPWDNWDLYIDLSPIKYVQNVKTPTLIVQSEEDHRTPMTDAEQWFMSLEKQGVPVEFVRYPRSTHDLSRTGEPWLLVDRLGRLRQWFAYWLMDGSTVAAGETPDGVQSQH